MASETAKSMGRRLRDPLFTRFVMRGSAIDIGAGPDGLSKWQYLWPQLSSVRDWDWADGDAQLLEGIEKESYDLVYSSHCLEHLQAAPAALKRWWEVLRPGGYLCVTVPDEAMYEHTMWPPQYNRDHKWSFRIDGWSPMPKSLKLAQLLGDLGPDADIVRLERLVGTFDFSKFNITDNPLQDDQTQRGDSAVIEAAIEAVVRKRREEPGTPDQLQRPLKDILELGVWKR